MRAVAVIPGKENSAHLREVPDPAPNEREARVRVVEAGIDGTDREINAGLYGEAPEGESFLILGYEALGRVEAVGAEVGEVSPGDWVVPTVRRPDGCPNCRLGEVDMCLWGKYKERGIKQRHGFFSDDFVERPEYLIKIPEALRSVAVLLEPLSVAEKAIRQAFRIQRRMYWAPVKALVLGGGPIGLLSMLLCRLRDLETYVYDRDVPGSATARRVEETGAAFLSAQEQSVPDLARRVGRFDLIIESTGNSRVAFDAVCLVGNNGVLSLLGIYGGDRTLEVTAECIGLKLVLGNHLIFGSVNAHWTDFEAGLNDIDRVEQRWPGWLAKLITRRLPFDRFQEGMTKEKDDIKTLLEINPAV